MSEESLGSTSWEFRYVPGEGSWRETAAVESAERSRRLWVVAVLTAVLLSAALADALVGRGGPGTGAVGASGTGGGAPSGVASATVTGSTVASASAQSSAWFCAGGSPTGSSAPVTLEITNTQRHVVKATVSDVSPAGGANSLAVDVPARSQIAVVPPSVGAASWVGATVLLDGGGVGVSQVVNGPLGWSTSACASSTSSRWFFAHGSTASGSTLSLCIYNPLTTDAVVDVALESSSAGLLEPPAYQGIPVPARSLVVENVGDHLLNDPSVGTAVTTSSGTVVATELQSTPETGGGGSSLLLGVPSPSRQWEFPQSVDPSGGSVVFDVFNPSASAQKVSVGIGLSGAQAEPLSLEVPAYSVADVLAEHETRIPTGSPYELTFDSSGAGVVVDRELSAPAGSLSPQAGEVDGVEGGSSRSLVPAEAAGTSVESVAICDVTSRPVRVTVESATDHDPLAGFFRRVIEPGRPLLVSPPAGSPIGSKPMLVVASGEVAVEVDAGPSGAPGAVALPVLVMP